MEWTKVSAVDEYDVGERSVTFHCATAPGEERLTDRPWTVPVTLSFYGPTAFRLDVDAAPEVGAAADDGPAAPERLPELDEDAIREPVSVEVTERDGEVTVATDALRVVVGTESWTFRVEDDAGTTVFEEEREAVDVRGNERVDPLGFGVEEVNQGPRRVAETGTAFQIAPEESIYGLGEQFTELDRVGREFDLWHVEPLGTETEKAYKNVPFHCSTAGYGLLVDTTSRVQYDLGHSVTGSGRVTVDDDRFGCVFFYGPSLKEVLRQYTGLTGRPDRPPKWSFGVWMSKLGYESRAELESITDRLRAEEIPSDVVHLDPFWMRENHSCDLTWDTEQFPDPEGMIDELHEKDFRLSLWEHPHVPVWTAAFDTGIEEGYFLETPSGRPYVMDRTCQGDYRGAMVDFTNPDAVEWWRGKHRELLEMGVDVFKTDYGEYIPEDAVFDDGRTGAAMHNVYPYLYNRTVYDVSREVKGDEGMVWARSAWTGSQRFPVHWGGDPSTTRSGMAAALRGGLSASLSGIAFWSHDIGGFRGTPSPELYVRWAQFGLLSSHARCHGTTAREPWAFGEEATDLFREYARLRYRLLPTIYTYAEVATRTGLPVVRPLVLEYPEDPRTHDLDTQFLLGEDLLVAPVFEESGERSVYLPDGEWADFWSGERHAGGQTVTMEADLDTLPLFVRAGSVRAEREPTQSVQPGTPSELHLRATLAEGGAEGRYYDPDADALVECEVHVEDGSAAVTIPDLEADLVVVELDADVAVDAVTVDGATATRDGDRWRQEGDATAVEVALRD